MEFGWFGDALQVHCLNDTWGLIMNLAIFEEQIFFGTVRIATTANHGSGSSIGTGFLFKSPLSDNDKAAVVLLISNLS